MPEAQKTTGQRLNEYMVRTCRNKSAVARKANIPNRTLDAILRDVQKCSTERLVSICTAMETPISTFLDD